jgi:hypothetical protein
MPIMDCYIHYIYSKILKMYDFVIGGGVGRTSSF